ncbi:MAG: dTDP-4-dehydrorhamnose 3,5-epimerase [Deltaproteobacteria bacterium]|nr:dTDP-4-dehydrorhamnose 3,5-epimerase [Deltaproteobacteria bacterium]
MIFTETALKGAYVIDLQPMEDERGYFARSFCRKEFAQYGLKFDVAQCNVSFNRKKGTLRGMHFQLPPKAEAKLVRCARGSIYDVIVDLRSNSPTYCRWTALELTESNLKMFYIPEGFAHGFQTLSDDTEVFYQMFEFYSPEHASGVRWDDPAFGIRWPLDNPVISRKDRSYPLFGKQSSG